MDTHEEKKSTDVPPLSSPSSLGRLVNLLSLARRKHQAPVLGVLDTGERSRRWKRPVLPATEPNERELFRV